jgi:hypothetical protein
VCAHLSCVRIRHEHVKGNRLPGDCRDLAALVCALPSLTCLHFGHRIADVAVTESIAGCQRLAHLELDCFCAVSAQRICASPSIARTLESLHIHGSFYYPIAPVLAGLGAFEALHTVFVSSSEPLDVRSCMRDLQQCKPLRHLMVRIDYYRVDEDDTTARSYLDMLTTVCTQVTSFTIVYSSRLSDNEAAAVTTHLQDFANERREARAAPLRVHLRQWSDCLHPH